MPDGYGPRQLKSGCTDCGVGAGEKCWDMRLPVGERHRDRPHPWRGRDQAARRTPTMATAKARRRSQFRLYPENRGKGNLTVLEGMILRHIADGLANPAIARRVGESLDSVKFLVRDILWKLNAACRAQAVHEAYQRGILKVPGQ